jgi:hypothetical protein
MVNYSVIQVEVVAPEKLLEIKHLFENNLDADFTVYIVSKYLCVDMAICDSQKYFVLI